MGDRVILHCDLNCFFASVELLSHPDLREIPTAVCGDPASRHGIILAKNEPAKQMGVQTAETVWQAKQKCPHLVLLPPHHNLYADYSRRVNAIYGQYTDLVEPFGIDESWLDLTGSAHLFGGDLIRVLSQNHRQLALIIQRGNKVAVGGDRFSMAEAAVDRLAKIDRIYPFFLLLIQRLCHFVRVGLIVQAHANHIPDRMGNGSGQFDPVQRNHLAAALRKRFHTAQFRTIRTADQIIHIPEMISQIFCHNRLCVPMGDHSGMFCAIIAAGNQFQNATASLILDAIFIFRYARLRFQVTPAGMLQRRWIRNIGNPFSIQQRQS